MPRAWYMDDGTQDQRLTHNRDCRILKMDEVWRMTGVEYFRILPEFRKEDELMKTIKKIRGYTYEDEITCSKECLENYEEKLKEFYTEHLHTDDEVRLVLDGSGYFDVRDKNDEWIRIEVVPGDLLIIPSGIYHRFTVDVNNYIKAARFFSGMPIWIPYNRPCDDMECRKEYLKFLESGFEKDTEELCECLTFQHTKMH